MEEALKCLKSRWREVGIQLHQRNSKVKSIYGKHMEPARAMGKIISIFLSCNYSVVKFGPPTWKIIVEAVEKPAGGANIAYLEKRCNND